VIRGDGIGSETRANILDTIHHKHTSSNVRRDGHAGAGRPQIDPITKRRARYCDLADIGNAAEGTDGERNMAARESNHESYEWHELELLTI
jgi:hypothetical protein